MPKNLKASMICNALVVVLVTFSAICAFFSINFMGDSNILTYKGLENFKFFTVDSNLLAGVCCLVYLIQENMVKKGIKQAIPTWAVLLKFTGTVSVTITLLVVLFFLAPLLQGNAIGLFYNHNLFMHLINPVICIVSLLCFERIKIKPLQYQLTAMIPFALYEVYYSINALSHIENGAVSSKYDWYHLLFAGVNTAPIVIVVMVLVVLLITLIMGKLNNGRSKKIS